MSKTARQICIENADIPASEGQAMLRGRFVEVADAIRIYKAKDMIRPTADATRSAALSIGIILNLVKFICKSETTEDQDKAKKILKLNLIKVAETVAHNIELTESVVMSSMVYSMILPMFYNKESVENPKMKEHLQSFEFESELVAAVYRSMCNAKDTLMALKFLFNIGWAFDIDLDEELIQLTKEEE